MANEDRPILTCFISVPFSDKIAAVSKAIIEAVEATGIIVLDGVALIESVSDSAKYEPFKRKVIRRKLSQSDIFIADISGNRSSIVDEIGLAMGMGKPIVFIGNERSLASFPDIINGPILFYRSTPDGLNELKLNLQSYLEKFVQSPNSFMPRPVGGQAQPFLVDWDRLEQRDRENLCRELLIQMGYRNVEWGQNKSKMLEVDVVAELPKNDPDGYEYSEFWLISFRQNIFFHIEEFFHVMRREPEYIFREFFRFGKQREKNRWSETKDLAFTFLFILWEEDSDFIEELKERRFSSSKYGNFGIRLRVWDRSYLTSLVQQHPQIGYKYFSDEGLSRLKYRKTPEELYLENVKVTNDLTKANTELQEEKDKRIRAERDSVWKDISFSAAHKIGNPIFAIETNLNPLQKRVVEGRKDEAVEVIGNIRASVEKAKGIVDQFKSLTRAQEINPVPSLLRPILEDACQIARNCGATCEIDCPNDLLVQADPERLGECFDELASNAIHWFDKEVKSISIKVENSAPFIPSNLDSSQQYVLLNFADNGPGVELEIKERIFDAFFTKYEHGTGLGLALVRRIIEGHGGAICERGFPGKGAAFEIYLPLPEDERLGNSNRIAGSGNEE